MNKGNDIEKWKQIDKMINWTEVSFYYTGKYRNITRLRVPDKWVPYIDKIREAMSKTIGIKI